MSGSFRQGCRYALTVSLLCSTVGSAPVRAQQPPPDSAVVSAPAGSPPRAAPSAADYEKLEKRVLELEALVRTLATRQAPTPPAAPTPTTPTPPAESGPDVPRPEPSMSEILQNSTEESEQGAGDPGRQIGNSSPGTGGIGIAAGSFPSGSSSSGSGGGSSGGGKSSNSPAFKAGWTEAKGFFLADKDDKFVMRITGQLQGDYRAYLDGRDATDFDSFLVRRARLGVEAEMFKYYEFRLLPDFSSGQSNTTNTAITRINDAYINIHYWDCLQLEMGKFKQPFSYEQLIQDRFLPEIERSLIDQLSPARDVGVMVHGQKLFGDKVDYYLSAFNGEINADYDQNKGKDMAARVVVRPLNWELVPEVFHRLQIGISGSWGMDQEPIGSTTPTPLRTPDQVPFFAYTAGVRSDGPRTRYSPEASYFYGPFGIAAQYFRGDQHMRPAGANLLSIDVPQHGFYVLGTLLLTGEERTTYSQPITPRHNFDPCHPWCCPGAWELFARVSSLRLSDSVFQPIVVGRTTFGPLANPLLFSQGATELTVGFNWYLNRFVRVQFNYEHDWFDENVLLGSPLNGRLKAQDSLLTRLQLIF